MFAIVIASLAFFVGSLLRGEMGTCEGLHKVCEPAKQTSFARLLSSKNMRAFKPGSIVLDGKSNYPRSQLPDGASFSKGWYRVSSNSEAQEIVGAFRAVFGDFAGNPVQLLSAGNLSVSIGELLPKSTRELLGTTPSGLKPVCDANCANATKFLFDGNTTLGETDVSDMPRWFKAKFDALPDGDQLNPGDVFAVWGSESARIHGAPLHTSVYIGDDVVYQKGAARINSPWGFERFDDSIAFYERFWSGYFISIHRAKTKKK